MKTKAFYKQEWIKEEYGSLRLFEACWRDLLRDIHNNKVDDSNALVWLYLLAREKVNNRRSSFYMYG